MKGGVIFLIAIVGMIIAGEIEPLAAFGVGIGGAVVWVVARAVRDRGVGAS